MNKTFLPSPTSVLAGLFGLLFTALSFLVQQDKLPSEVLMVALLPLVLFALWGFIRRFDWRALVRPSVIGGALLLSFATVAFSQPTPLNEDIWGKVKVCLMVLPAGWLLLAGLWMGLRRIRLPERHLPPLPASIVIGLYTAGALCLSWMDWYPSGTSPDTRHQWGQIHGTLRLNDIHALGHTLYLKGLLAIWDDYAIAILAHILMISLLYSLFAWYLAKRGLPTGWMLMLTALFTACETPTRSYMYPWKDTPYTFAVGMLTLMLLYLLEEGPKFSWPKAILTGLALAWSTLFRLNGVVVLLVVGLWLLFAAIRTKAWKQLAAGLAAVMVSFGTVNYLGYHVYGAESPDNGFSIQVFVSGLSAMNTQCGPELSREDREAIGDLLSPTWMVQYYEPWRTRYMIWTYETYDPEGIFDDPNMEIMVNNFVLEAGKNKNEIVKLYFKLMPHHLGVCIRDAICNTYAVWGYTSTTQFFYNNIFLLVLLMVGVGAVWRGKTIRRKLILFAPVICNAVSIAISTITNEERYLLPSFTLFPMLLCCLICLSDFRPGRQEEVPQAETPAAPLPEAETLAAEPTA